MAITYVSASTNPAASASSLTYAFSTSGNNRFIATIVSGEVGTSDLITGVTYGGAAMTLAAKVPGTAGVSRYLYFYYLVAPASGSNNIVVSASSSTYIRSNTVLYNGVAQISPVDIYTTNHSNSATSLTTTLVVSRTIDNSSWCILMAQDPNGCVAGTNSTPRATTGGDYQTFDSNGISPAGSFSMTFTNASSYPMDSIMVALKAYSTTTLKPRPGSLGSLL